MECSWNDGGKTKYYVVILDQLQSYSGGLVRAPESRVRGPLTLGYEVTAMSFFDNSRESTD